MLYVIRYTYAKQNKKKGEKNMTYDMFDINKSYSFYHVIIPSLSFDNATIGLLQPLLGGRHYDHLPS